ncbi:RagB/SusD family nutrient uptake outer membrane protein [Myroides sp. DF42-4-2]|uniref:RagB/SusD family nutrient uptake outer membrane protein n=1 Tax=unclassified Myroides TaxID=2642485 RepID=UPI002575564A|nr:RagB/SusD family nutrient uptake outer membrane protein [Myroides sp. DF42-4-2]MDM1408719.1 RagB/SusD family nutrient uptake outer membrane protein [Myroides sp. DF42-4-2]
MKKLFLFIGCISLSATTVSCDKFLDIEPEGKIIPKTTDDYRKFLTSAYQAYPNHKSLTTIRTDEVQINMIEDSEIITVRDIYAYNDQNPDASTKEFPYETLYKVIFYANSTINDGSKTMQEGDTKEQLLGEAYALRALAYFDLVNLFAKPYNPANAATEPAIVILNQVEVNSKKPKSTMAEVYAQIHADIEQAKSLLKVSTYDAGSNYRFSKLAIYALEARVNLFQQQYQQAITSAENAMAIKSNLQNLNTTKDVSVANFKSVESIMNLEDVYTQNFNKFIYVSEELKATFDVENDWRYAVSFDKIGEQLVVVKTGNDATRITFRTAELYFIKAEAYVFLNQLDQATQALAPILENRYKPEAAAVLLEQLKGFNQAQYKTYLLEERFREFAFEGQRWNDLRRLNQRKIVHKLGKDEFILQQNDPRYTLPFPRKARENNPNL